MLFLRVSDLLLVCVVLNHDADSLLYIIKNNIFIENKWEIAVGKECLLVDSLVPCFKTENDIKFCLSTWVTLCPNMAERCRHKKCHLCFILFVYALLVHPPVGHMPKIDGVVCLWLWNIFVMILVTMNERQQVFRCKNIVGRVWKPLPSQAADLHNLFFNIILCEYFSKINFI